MHKQTATLIVTVVVAGVAGVVGGAGLTARAEAEARTAAAAQPAQDAASGDSAWIVTAGGVEYCFLYNGRPYCRGAQPWN